MRSFLGALICLATVATVWGTPPQPFDHSNSWALLVAGSSGFMNYRHQADVCHSYHVLLNQGFSPDKIITMMYDDIAFSSENPAQGVIINQPGGVNVYAGVKIDYRGGELTPNNFLNILKGDEKAMKKIGTGRVVKSNHNSDVFVYFADHGGPGILAFPSEYLLAPKLEATLVEMHQKKRYSKLFFYVEACESGSMFDNVLRQHMNVFAMTAAARDESSWGVYCDPTCLGDEFSVRWLEQMDSEPVGKMETFFHQYQTLRTRVHKSHVNIYGDLQLGANVLVPRKRGTDAENPSNKDEELSQLQVFGNYVNSRDVPLHYLGHLAMNEKNSTKKAKAQIDLQNLIQGRKRIDELFDDLIDEPTYLAPEMKTMIKETKLTLDKKIFPCYTKLIKRFTKHCFNNQHEYILKHFYKFVNMCVMNVNTEAIIERMPKICALYKRVVKSPVL